MVRFLQQKHFLDNVSKDRDCCYMLKSDLEKVTTSLIYDLDSNLSFESHLKSQQKSQIVPMYMIARHYILLLFQNLP